VPTAEWQALGTKRVILHIGRHKTGTSSLQHFLSENDAALQTAGLLYPRAMRRPVAHHALAYLCNPRIFDRFSESEQHSITKEYAQLREEVSTAPGVLLSSEAFQNAPPENVAAIVGVGATVVVYLREQLDYLISAYAQAVKNQRITESLEDYEKRVFRADYDSFLVGWGKALPRGTVVVRLFSEADLTGGDIRRDFVEAIGIERDPNSFVFGGDDRNVSIGGALLEFKRRLNQTAFDSLIPPARLYRLLQKVAKAAPEINTGQAVSERFARFVREKYEESNEAVRRTYFPSREQLFRTAAGNREMDSRNTHPMNKVAQVIDDLEGEELGRRLLRLIESA
jgi:hypothetical protein